MKTIRTIIIDDEKHARESISKLLELYCPNIEVIGEAANIIEGKRIIEEMNPALVFLDISIGENTGFELLEELLPIKFHLIFTTAFSEYALKAFRVNALDYLLKPIEPSQLQVAVKKIKQDDNMDQLQQQLKFLTQNLTPKPNKQIAISNINSTTFLNIDNIVHIEGSANYSTFHIINEDSITASKGLKHFASMLPMDCFFRSHQSHVVNINHIKKISSSDGNLVEMKNGNKIPLALKRKEELLILLSERLLK
ncbi:MAG: LytR/AlgR family response regulator transcription factor [Saprospiraceae bacterium]